MKTTVKIESQKFIIKKNKIVISSLLSAAIILFLVSGCIKEDQQVRLVFPVVTTAAISDSTTNSAIGGGNITSDGGFAITARGVCWSTSGNPSTTYADSITTDGTGSGQFTSNISGLLAMKKYHVRAYATNSQGTTYGKDISFTTLAK